MKTNSIERRIVVTVVAVQLALAVCITVFGFLYERHAQFRAFDIALHGKADSVFGAVQDANDANDDVVLDTKDLRLPHNDVFVVRESSGKVVGSSGNLKDFSALPGDGPDGHFMTFINGHRYRGIRLHVVRTIDPGTSNIRHALSVVYAARTGGVHEAINNALEFFIWTNLALVLVTAALVSYLVRRSMRPLDALAREASRVSAPAWRFTPPASAVAIRELSPVAHAIEGVVERLELSLAQQRQFLGDAAHELKTAVAVVKSSLQLLTMRPRSSAEYQEGVARAEADCGRMEELVGRMLALARIEAASPQSSNTFMPEDTPLLDGVRSAIEQLRPIAEMMQVRVEATGEDAPMATIAPDLWQTLCSNLLLNAIQYSAPGTDVTAHVSSIGRDAVQCVVEDHGQGIAAESLAHVFDRFYRGDPSRSRASGGTGLGLAICKAIAEQSGGSISIESSPGVGTRVTVRLPLAARCRQDGAASA